MAPVVKRRPAKTSEYTATTHWSCDSLALSARDSVGRVTLRLAFPTKTMTRLMHSTVRIHHRRAWMYGSVSLSGRCAVASATTSTGRRAPPLLTSGLLSHGVLLGGVHDQPGRFAAPCGVTSTLCESSHRLRWRREDEEAQLVLAAKPMTWPSGSVNKPITSPSITFSGPIK